eukprot:CAMPEP_0202442776 /NCGR_PEP_ID=MMETSP1360-20130828/2142_1 /ASSEMBLY_ACC=CAM_ASM_000848 /TAXON_ID=515479 /ORGANISM="Licmophora paradoxa, Strain CCMP2313" /LENGTH=174 /DNA_ID=CAMNT_0049058227 /DNA_START=50 /DNA_END=574 /DNA_ORIENTATION=-
MVNKEHPSDQILIERAKELSRLERLHSNALQKDYQRQMKTVISESNLHHQRHTQDEQYFQTTLHQVLTQSQQEELNQQQQEEEQLRKIMELSSQESAPETSIATTTTTTTIDEDLEEAIRQSRNELSIEDLQLEEALKLSTMGQNDNSTYPDFDQMSEEELIRQAMDLSLRQNY